MTQELKGVIKGVLEVRARRRERDCSHTLLCCCSLGCLASYEALHRAVVLDDP